MVLEPNLFCFRTLEQNDLFLTQLFGLSTRRSGGSRPREAPELFFNLRGLAFPSGLLGELRVTAGQFLEAGVSFDGLGDERQFFRADALAVVFAVLVALQQVIGAVGENACGAFALIGLLAEMATDHGIDTGHLLEELSSLLLDRRC